MNAYHGRIIDCDSHLYEDLDELSSFIPEAYKAGYTLSHKETPEGGYPVHIGGKPISYGEEYRRPDGSIPKPGELKEWLKAVKTGGGDHLWVPIPEDARSPQSRLKTMDEWNVESCVVFPSETITILPFIDRIDALSALLGAYNDYVEEGWGFGKSERLNMTAMLHLDDLDWALKELDRVLKLGARAIALPTGPFQQRSPADPMFDPFWERVNDAKAIVGLHIGQAPYLHSLLKEWGEPVLAPVTGKSAWDWMNCMGETPIVHTLSSIIYLNFFERFPNIKVLSAENGADWVPSMLKRMDKMRGMARNGRWPCGQLKEKPSAIFKRNVFVVPYPEDDLRHIIDSGGGHEYLVMGSDYPHAEGVRAPNVFLEDIHGLSEEEKDAVMYGNGKRMFG